jgi:hypothetical protein
MGTKKYLPQHPKTPTPQHPKTLKPKTQPTNGKFLFSINRRLAEIGATFTPLERW